MQGTYHIKMVLPAWIVENELTMEPGENGMLGGSLNTLDGIRRCPSPGDAGTKTISGSIWLSVPERSS